MYENMEFSWYSLAIVYTFLQEDIDCDWEFGTSEYDANDITFWGPAKLWKPIE